MNFNDLMVKITRNDNYVSLQENKKEQINALVKGYEDYSQKMIQSFNENLNKLRDDELKRINNQKKWGTVLNIATLGRYSLVKGVVNGITDFVTGSLNLGTQLVNNIGQVFVDENRFGDDTQAFLKEIGSDLLYTFANPVIDIADSFVRSGASVGNIFGMDDKTFNEILNFTDKKSVDLKSGILTLGENQSGINLGNKLIPKKDELKEQNIKEQTFDSMKDFSTSVAKGGTWFKNEITPKIAKIITPEGKLLDDFGQTQVGDFISETMESVGRMIPAIVSSYFGNSSNAVAQALGSTLSKTYFFSSSFGGGFSEAIDKGASIEEAYNYAYGVATIESLTEQIGGVKLGEVLPGSGKFFKDLISSAVEEGIEEVMSEFASAGLESIISDSDVDNKDFISRAVFSFLGGALSGGIFGAFGSYNEKNSSVGKIIDLNNEIDRIYQDEGKDFQKAQKNINNKINSLLNQLNKKTNLDMDLESKKALLENRSFFSSIIEFNEKSNRFELNQKGIDITNNLESFVSDVNKDAYSNTLYGLEEDLVVKPTNKEITQEQKDVMKLSKKLGSNVVFYSDGNNDINGFFKDGIIYLNVDSNKDILINFTHELTHSLEGTSEYNDLKNFINKIGDTNQVLIDKMNELGLKKEDIVKKYWNQINKLKNIESKDFLVASEYVAFAMSEVILGDKESINDIAKNKNFANKVLDWINQKVKDIKNPSNKIEKAFMKELINARKLYRRALDVGHREGLSLKDIDKRFSFVSERSLERFIERSIDEFIEDSNLDGADDKLNQAREMYLDGVETSEIEAKTGWVIDKDGNWKFKMSDKNMTIKQTFIDTVNNILAENPYTRNLEEEAFTLDEIIEHDSLFNLYPSLKDLTIMVDINKRIKGFDYETYFYDGTRSDKYKKSFIKISFFNEDNNFEYFRDNVKLLENYLKTLKKIKKLYKTDEAGAMKLIEVFGNDRHGYNIKIFLETFFNPEFRNNLSFKETSFLDVGNVAYYTYDEFGFDYFIERTKVNILNNKELLRTSRKQVFGDVLYETLRGDLIHEIQHYIQSVEKWSRGGNIRDGYIYTIRELFRGMYNINYINSLNPEMRTYFIEEVIKNFPVIETNFNNYLRFQGEVEARESERHLDMTQEEIIKEGNTRGKLEVIKNNTKSVVKNPLTYLFDKLVMKNFLVGFNEYESPFDSNQEADLYENEQVDIEISNDLKNAIEYFMNKDNVRYSLEMGDNEIVVDTESINDDLVALHNIGENNLIKTIELGGFPMPSIAVTKPNMNHEGYGDITVIFGKGTIDPKKTTKNKVWSGDKWTSTFPQIEYEIDTKVIRELGEKTGLEVFDHQGYRIERMLMNYGLEGTVESIASNPDTKEYFEKNPPENGLTVEEYLTEAIDNAILNIGIRNNVELFTNLGNRRSFSQTHYKVSLENILKSMIDNETKKGVFYGGTGSMAASDMKKYGSIKEIKKDIWKIVDENTTDAQKVELENQLLDVVSDILDNKKHVDKNRFIAFDNAETILRELGGDGVNKTNIEKWYKEYEINGSEELTNKIIQMFENLRNKYIRYFESKPERIVNLNEIKNVLLPKETNQKLIDLLNENNIPYEVYGEEGRTTHIENMKDIRFSKTIDSKGRKLTVEQELFFKDSKVRDEQGNLLVMYHGSSNSDFNVFDTTKIGENFPSYSVGGFYFTNKMETAEYYGQNGHIKEVYLNITNPYILKANEDWYNGSDWFDINPQQHYEQAIQNGNDGIIVEQKYGNMVLAFESNQIKNVNNLIPTSSEDIRYSKNDLDIKISNEKIFSGDDERNMRIFTYGDGKGYDIDGGFISVIENSPYSPVNGNSIYDFFVNEEKRRKGIGTELFQKALKEFDGKLSGQFSSEQSVIIAWKNGLRNSEYKTLNEVLKALRENSSVFLEIGYNLTPTSDVDVRYSRNLENGIDNFSEIETFNEIIKTSYSSYNKDNYIKDLSSRQKKFSEIKLKDISKTKNGKKRVEIIKKLNKKYENIIEKNYNKSEIYNHIFNNVIQETILGLAYNFEDKTFADKNLMLNNLETSISSTMAYLDDVFSNNELDKMIVGNPNGYQYTKPINFGLRELNESNDSRERNKILSDKKLTPIFDMLETIVKLDLEDNQTILEFMASIDNLMKNTRVEQKNSMNLSDDKVYSTSIQNVLRENSNNIENITKLVGTMELKSREGKKHTYARKKGLIGDFRLFDKFSGTRLDMFGFSNIFGMFMENSTGDVMSKRILEAQRKQLEVSNKFYEYFEKDGFLKNNSKKIDTLEKNLSKITNLTDLDGNPIEIPHSQILYLRNVILREIIRGRMIEQGIRGGQKSNYFKDGGFVFINGNSNSKKKNEANRIQTKITNVIDLFNELDEIVKKDSFMPTYNKKVLGFFELMYDFENIRNKDISGLELTNDRDTIKNLTNEQKEKLTKELGDVDISQIYVPLRSLGSNKASSSGAFDINNVIDLGIDDGMVMGITRSANPPLIDSINNIIPTYLRGVANYYGLYRIVNDLNILFNKEIFLEDGSKITLTDKVSKISPYIVPYYEKLLRDISGYGVASDSTSEGFNKFMGGVRRNFFKASLGLNTKVIMTQFASMFNIATIYGDYKGNKKSLMVSMMKNMFAKGSKTKAKYLIENSEIYKDRARNSTYEISEATSNAFTKGKFNEVTEFFMKGISITDNMINRAFFISLVEHGYSEQQALEITEEAINRYQSSGLSINKNELLRTQNELIKVFTKFLGEPMKVVSNLEESVKKNQIIKLLEKNKEDIKTFMEVELENANKLLDEYNLKLESLEKLYEKAKGKKEKSLIEKEIKKQEKEISGQEIKIKDITKNNKTFEKQIDGVISKKQEAKEELGKRLVALSLSVSWQALLGVIFSVIRSGGKDKEEDEKVFAYLGKKFGWQIANEMVGFLPFARDVYSLVIDNYDANVVSDFQAFNDLGSSISSIINDVSNGGEFNYGKHFRKVSLHLGQILGVPTRQIERLFTTPANYFMKSSNYLYKDITGQRIDSSELRNAIKNGDDRLIETIINRELEKKNVSLTSPVNKEIKRLAKNKVLVKPSGIPNKFSIDGVEYKNNKDKFAKVYNNASFIIEKIMTQNAYNRLDDEYKGKMIKSILNYYYNLAKQEVSGVAIYTKERTYNLSQAYNYFKSRFAYYQKEQNKNKKRA